MPRIIQNYQRLVKEDLLAFPVLDSMLQVLASVTVIPVEPRELRIFRGHAYIVYLLNIQVKHNIQPFFWRRTGI